MAYVRLTSPRRRRPEVHARITGFVKAGKLTKITIHDPANPSPVTIETHEESLFIKGPGEAVTINETFQIQVENVRYVFDHGELVEVVGDLRHNNEGSADVVVPGGDGTGTDIGHVDYLLINGFRGQTLPRGSAHPYFDKNLPNSFVESLSEEGVDPRSVEHLPVFEDLNGPTNDYLDLADIIDVIVAALTGSSSETQKILNKLHEIDQAQEESYVALSLSGGTQPLISALNIPKTDGTFYNVDTIINVGGPTLNAVIVNPNVKRVIHIIGDEDPFAPLISNRMPGVETINIRLTGGISHIDYFVDPTRLSTEPDENFLADKFLAALASQVDNEQALAAFLARLPLGPQNNRLPISERPICYEVDLYVWAAQNGINVSDLRQRKQVP